MATYTHPQGGQNFPWAAGGTAIGAGIAALMAKKKERLNKILILILFLMLLVDYWIFLVFGIQIYLVI